MPYDPERHHRRSIRLRGFDYRTPGLYVVTICTQHRPHLFGHITDGIMRPNAAGQMVQQTWDEIPDAYPGVDIDAFVVMPNHIHGIVFLVPRESDLYPSHATDLVRATPCGCPRTQTDLTEPHGQSNASATRQSGANPEHSCGVPGQPQGVARTEGGERLSLPDVVHRFKTLTTKRYTDRVEQLGWTRYDGRLWHRNYYERIVRNDRELERFRRYIEANPARWFEDPYRDDG
jgi:putative transposase